MNVKFFALTIIDDIHKIENYSISIASINWCNRLKIKMAEMGIFFEYSFFYKNQLSFRRNLIRYFFTVSFYHYKKSGNYCFYGFSFINFFGVFLSRLRGSQTFLIVPDVWSKYQGIFPMVIKILKKIGVKIGFLSYKLAIDYDSKCIPGVIINSHNNQYESKFQQDKLKVISLMGNGKHNDHIRVIKLMNSLDSNFFESKVSLSKDLIEQIDVKYRNIQIDEWIDSKALNSANIGISFYSQELSDDFYNFPSKILEYFDNYIFVLTDKKSQIDPLIHPLCSFTDSANKDSLVFENLLIEMNKVELKSFHEISLSLTNRFVDFFRN